MALFKPFVMAKNITHITPEFLKQNNITALLLDVDNTLSFPFTKETLPGVKNWLKKMNSAGIKMFIVSNGKTQRVRPFAEELSLPFFTMCAKPLPFSVNKAIKISGIDKKEIALCGDQLFTDMLCAHLIFAKSIFVEPSKPETRPNFKIKRRLEKPFLKRYKKTVKSL